MTEATAKPSVKALVFDVFGTVVDWRTSVAREMRMVAEARGWAADPYALADRWRALYQPSMDPIRRGEKPSARLDDLHRERLKALLAEFGLPALPAAELEHLKLGRGSCRERG